MLMYEVWEEPLWTAKFAKLTFETSNSHPPVTGNFCFWLVLEKVYASENINLLFNIKWNKRTLHIEEIQFCNQDLAKK